MKLMVSGDKHLGLISDGMERLEEQARLLNRTIEILNDEDPDIYVDLGDLFHVPKPSPAAYDIAFQYLCKINKWAGTREKFTFLMVGNHDKQTRGDIHALTPFIPVINYFNKIVINNSPSTILMSMPNHIYVRGYYLVFLPHLTDWEAMKMDYSNAEMHLNEYADYLLDKFIDKPMIVFAHLEVPGAKMSNNETVQRDTGLQIPNQLLTAKNLVHAYAGHIHKYQEMEKVTIVGSALHVDFGEANDQKGVIISNIDTQLPNEFKIRRNK